MNDMKLGLTVKHVEESGNIVFLAVNWLKLVWLGEGQKPMVQLGAADDDSHHREAWGGRVYVMNASGKTIDVLDLEQVQPVMSGNGKAIDTINIPNPQKGRRGKPGMGPPIRL